MLKLAKTRAKDRQHLEAKLENYSLSSSTLSFKNNRIYSKKCVKNKYVCLNDVI